MAKSGLIRIKTGFSLNNRPKRAETTNFPRYSTPTYPTIRPIMIKKNFPLIFLSFPTNSNESTISDSQA